MDRTRKRAERRSRRLAKRERQRADRRGADPAPGPAAPLGNDDIREWARAIGTPLAEDMPAACEGCSLPGDLALATFADGRQRWLCVTCAVAAASTDRITNIQRAAEL
jgi:hypothetical protein